MVINPSKLAQLGTRYKKKTNIPPPKKNRNNVGFVTPNTKKTGARKE